MDDSIVNAEVIGVLMALGNRYISKIPTSVIKYFIDNCDKNSIPSIDPNKRIEELNISKDARILLTVLKLKYWCKSDEEKENLMKILNENEKKKNAIT